MPADSTTTQKLAALVGLIVIYCRYSSQHQREDSLKAQEQKARQRLRELGLDDTRAVVLGDKAQRGDSESREQYNRLLEMIGRKEVALLIVDEQSRFSRGCNVQGLIQDLVFAGGRFIAVGDSIDTARPGWEPTVGLKGIVNQMETRSTGHRVRRSQELRASTPSGSAGDFPYGYKSVYEDPQAAASYNGRGPKPAKRIEVDEAQAEVVREVFRRFTDGQSLQGITRWLNEQGGSIPRVGKAAWHHMHTRRILDNEKYVGRWTFGRTTTLRDSRGRKKQVPVGPQQAVTRADRSHLRLIDDAAWSKTQARLRKLAEVYGAKPGQKRRGPRVHYTQIYPTSLLAGKIRCARCGSIMHLTAGGGKKQFACPTHRNSTCPMAARVPRDAAERAVLNTLAEVLRGWPGWLNDVYESARQVISERVARVPEELELARRRLADVEDQVSNLVDALGRRGSSTAIEDRLAQLEEEQHRLHAQVEALSQTGSGGRQSPTRDQLRQELAVLASDLLDPGSMPDLREMVVEAIAEDVMPRGKRRGWARLLFRIDGVAILRRLIGDHLPQGVAALLAADVAGVQGEQFEIEFGRPSRADELAPAIANLRERGLKWSQIAEETGLSLGAAHAIHKRWAEAS